jgi:hypothetical protein
MEPSTALAIASAVIQVVDFSSKVIARTREVYHSADGSIEENAHLQEAAANLEDLMLQLKSGIRKAPDIENQSTPHQRLLQLAQDSQIAADRLRKLLNKVKFNKNGDQRMALGQGLRSVLEQNNISALKARLDEIRKQVDTTLLVALR